MQLLLDTKPKNVPEVAAATRAVAFAVLVPNFGHRRKTSCYHVIIRPSKIVTEENGGISSSTRLPA